MADVAVRSEHVTPLATMVTEVAIQAAHPALNCGQTLRVAEQSENRACVFVLATGFAKSRLLQANGGLPVTNGGVIPIVASLQCGSDRLALPNPRDELKWAVALYE